MGTCGSRATFHLHSQSCQTRSDCHFKATAFWAEQAVPLNASLVSLPPLPVSQARPCLCPRVCSPPPQRVSLQCVGRMFCTRLHTLATW